MDHYRFKKLPYDKKRRILRAAYYEFARNGYQNTSTNMIVRQAGIGKGMLFHYFGSKPELFSFLVNHAIQIFETIPFEWAVQHSQNPLQRYMYFVQAKRRLLRQYPEAFSLLVSLYTQGEEDLEQQLAFARLIRVRQEYQEALLADVDMECFRKDISPQTSRFHIEQLVKAYWRVSRKKYPEGISRIQVYDSIWKEFEAELDTLAVLYLDSEFVPLQHLSIQKFDEMTAKSGL